MFEADVRSLSVLTQGLVTQCLMFLRPRVSSASHLRPAHFHQQYFSSDLHHLDNNFVMFYWVYYLFLMTSHVTNVHVFLLVMIVFQAFHL